MAPHSAGGPAGSSEAKNCRREASSGCKHSAFSWFTALSAASGCRCIPVADPSEAVRSRPPDVPVEFSTTALNGMREQPLSICFYTAFFHFPV